MKLYLGPKMVHGKYEKTNFAGSVDRDSTVYAGLVLREQFVAVDLLKQETEFCTLPNVYFFYTGCSA
jgi:hypothetical protein